MAVVRGVERGVDRGVNRGVNAGAGALADRDATSNIYVPSSLAQFSALGLPVPKNVYLCQEASGNLVDSLGVTNLTANGTADYNQAITGWTRTAVVLTETAAERFSAAAAAGPNPAAGSVAWLFYVNTATTPGSNRRMVAVSEGGGGLLAQLTTGNKWQCYCNGVAVNGTANMNDADVHPLLLVYNKTAGTAKLYSDDEKIASTYSSGITDSTKGIGATASTSAPVKFLWGCTFESTNAEFSDATAKSALQALGWTIPWS